ncbi:MAG: Gfo/Idh/MocA family oxidoreductase [Thermoguttaceae bacterium]
MSEQSKTSRRGFLKGTTAAIAGASLAGSLGAARSAHAAGNDVIKVALVGCGGRGTGAVAQMMGADKGVKLIAVADAFGDRAQGAIRNLTKEYPGQVDVGDRVYTGLKAYEQAIASDAELVAIATPPGFRPQQYSAAIDAGKHVFMEKPCCVDGPGYLKLMKANKLADEKNLFVGVGLQRRHEPQYMETVQRIQEGAIGKVMFTRVYWNGGGIWNRKRTELAGILNREPTELEYQVYNWYHFCWLSGDNICEQHIHNLDVGNWVMKDAHPTEANGMGGCTARYLGDLKGTGQIFDHHFVEFTYEDGTKMFSQCRHMANTWTPVSEAAHGTAGTSDCNGTIEGENAWKFRGKKVSGHQQEQTDLIAAMRAGNRYNEGYVGANSSMTAVLGRLANYCGQIVKWDDAVNRGVSEFPQSMDWNADAPVTKDENGNYPIPMPGVYSPYAS